MNNRITSDLRSYVVIPARLASTRLPAKMLLAETGQTLVEHTYANACRATHPAGVVVATDSEAIAHVVRRQGGKVLLTSAACACGTDRVAEAAQSLPDADILVNVQGDEPELEPAAIDQVIEVLLRNPDAVMATLATPIRALEKLTNPACVKVVFDVQGRALYFSRSQIPFIRDGVEAALELNPPLFHQHIGIYAYRREFLLELSRQAPSSLEQAEKLEQLRVLQSGRAIAVGVIQHAAAGIDTPDDYAQFVARQHAA